MTAVCVWQELQEAASTVVTEAAGIHPYKRYPAKLTRRLLIVEGKSVNLWDTWQASPKPWHVNQAGLVVSGAHSSKAPADTFNCHLNLFFLSHVNDWYIWFRDIIQRASHEGGRESYNADYKGDSPQDTIRLVL